MAPDRLLERGILRDVIELHCAGCCLLIESGQRQKQCPVHRFGSPRPKEDSPDSDPSAAEALNWPVHCRPV